MLRGDANDRIQELCDKDWPKHRAVLFLDPYGMQVEWKTIEAVARTRPIDMWLLFPLGIGVNRLLTKSGEIPPSWRSRLDLLLGTTDWYELQPHAIELPLAWKTPQSIFVNSMSDLFHERVPRDFILRVFDAMRRASWHRFQVLTKRAERLAELDPRLTWAPNIWMGVTVENRRYVSRIDYLRSVRASLEFLSLDPLLGPLPSLDLTRIDWVIVGEESGPGCRPMDSSWVIDVRAQCLAAGVPFFFKQWGGARKKKACSKAERGTACRYSMLTDARGNRLRHLRHPGPGVRTLASRPPKAVLPKRAARRRRPRR